MYKLLDDCVQSESYSTGVVTAVDKLVDDAVRRLQDVDFDTMAGRGLSGSLIIPILAREMGKHFFIVRKSDEDCHSWQLGEGRIGRRWIFVDDFIASGVTQREVISRVNMVCRKMCWTTEFVGSYLYVDGGFVQPEAR